MATTVRERVRRVLGRALTAVSGQKPATRRPASPFDAWNFERADQAIDDAFDNQSIDVANDAGSGILPSPGGTPMFQGRQTQTNPIVVNRLFYQGDHWQNGDGWIGPHPERENAAFTTAMQEIANLFTSKNTIRECVIRHALGVVGRNIQWGFAPIIPPDAADGAPSEEIQAKIKEATRLITPWLQSRKVATLLRDAVCTLLLSERAGIQLVIPPGLADKDGEGSLVIHAASVEEALKFIFPEHPLPDNACVVTDQDTKLEAGIWRYTSGRAEQGDELTGSETPTATTPDEVNYVAICFVDQDGETVIRVFRDGSDEVEAESFLNMGERIPMFEMRRAALITLQVQQAQRALNLAETMIPRTAITSGFLERVLIDAQLPGEPEQDAEGNDTGRWIEKPFYTGAGTTNFLESSEFEDEEGKIRAKRADIKWREPVSADGPIKASDKHYRSILDEVCQLHVVMAGDSNPSGSSRLTARIEYLATLQLTQGEVEAAFRFIIDTALAMAEALAEKPGEFTSVIRTQCACRLDGGPLLPAERQAIEASIGKTISQETAMMLVGIEDVDAEKARMAADPQARAVYGKTVGESIGMLTTPGATFEGAAKFIGVPDELISVLLAGALGVGQADPAPGGNPQPKGTKDPKKPEPPAKPIDRGPAKGGLDKKPLPAPATSVGIPGERGR
jgi:hypothetical protein